MMQKIEEVEVLQENYIVPDSMYDGLFSKTSQFMTPAIGINVTNKLVLCIHFYVQHLLRKHLKNA